MRVPAKRGRPPKFGRPATLVAVSLPDDVIARLRELNTDVGRAIVGLLENAGGRQSRPRPDELPLIELTRVFRGHSLIFVNPLRLPKIPRVITVPVAAGRAFLALEEPGGLAELELAVREALDQPHSRGNEELRLLATRLREWRLDQRLKVSARRILVVTRS